MIILFNKKEDCCGCTACKSICPKQAITMKSDEEGFLYPFIDNDLCIECGLCRDVCAFQNGYDTYENFNGPKVYAMKHKSDEIRQNSSSGGAFTAISDYVLSKDGLIYGVALDTKFDVIHKRAETAEERNKFRGSKYVQSDMREVFKEIKNDLDNDRFVLFSGTGCQVAGLNSYLAQMGRDVSRLLTVDLVCHGTPSPIIFADFLRLLEKKGRSKLIDYKFRSKINGWGHTEEATFENGKHDYTSKLLKCHKELFYSNLCLRPACYECKYTNFQRPADITLADFWGIKNFMPEFMDQAGISAVIVNNDNGQDVFESLSDNTIAIISNINDCAMGQANLFAPSPRNPKRDEFWEDYSNLGFLYIAKKYGGLNIKSKVKYSTVSLLKRIGFYDTVRKIIKSKIIYRK